MKLTKLNTKGLAHYIAPLIVVVLFAVAGVGYLVASHADGQNCVGTYKNMVSVCSVTSRAGNSVYASVRSNYNNTQENGTVYEQQCASNGTGCTTIAANSQNNAIVINTSVHPYSVGHLYKACASVSTHGDSAVTVTNLCTPATT